MEDIKLYTLQFVAFAFSFTNIDNILKIVLLVISIGYTAYKWWLLMKKVKDE